MTRLRRNATEILRGPSPLEYRHGYDVMRMALRDPSAPPSTNQIFGVYAYDKNKHVHVAELTPSYELTFLAFDYGETEKVADDEDLRERLNEMILEGQAEQELGTYMHVSDLDRLVAKHPKRDRSIQKYLDAPDPDESEREQEKETMDQIMEGWNSGSFMF